jgi:hypothetical protein
MRAMLHEIKYFLWASYGFLGLRIRAKGWQKVTVLITYYSPERMKHINHQIRNILKCDFVEKIIISNHNPDVDITPLIKVKDERITIVSQNIRRGCGYRWTIATQFAPNYLIVVDDDILLFPWQLKKLFAALLAEPAIPHGFAGMVHHENGFLEYCQKEERVLDYICEIYAISGEQLKRYQELRNEIEKDESLTDMVEFAADFMIVSRTGSGRPKIHQAGTVFRCPTYDAQGVAVHKDFDFDQNILKVASALTEFAPQSDA